jgi:hypothetical protein
LAAFTVVGFVPRADTRRTNVSSMAVPIGNVYAGRSARRTGTQVVGEDGADDTLAVAKVVRPHVQ